MSKHEARQALRTALIALYDNPVSIRRLVDDTGIEAGQINFQGAAQEIWHSVLTETERQEKIAALVKAVDKPYQNNKALQQAYQAYQQVSATDSSNSSQSVAASGSRSYVTINTGGGPYIAGNVNTSGDFVGRDKR